MARVQITISLLMIFIAGCQPFVSGSNEEKLSASNSVQETFHGRITGFHYLGLRPDDKEGEVIFLDVSPAKRARLTQDLTALNIKLDEGGNFDFVAEVQGRLSAVQHSDPSKECFAAKGMLDGQITRCIVVDSIQSAGQ